MFVTHKSKIILATATSFEVSGVGIEHARLPDVIECEIGVGQFLFQLRLGGNQLDHALRKN